MSNYIAAMSYIRFYFLIVFLALLFGAFGEMKRNKKKNYVTLTFLIFFIVMAFRSEYMGNDTTSYIALFKRISTIKSPQEFINISDVEAGYIRYCWLISRFWGERALFVISSAIVNFSVGRFVYKYVKYPGIFCCLFVGIMQFDFFLSAMRQSLSVALLLFAFDKIVENKKISFFILWYIAFQFHNSAIIFILIAPFIFKTKQEKLSTNLGLYFFLFITVFIASFMFDNVFEKILSIFPKYNYYINTELTDGETRIAVYLKIIVFALLLFVPKIYKYNLIKDIKIYNYGEKLSIINMSIMIVALNATALMRFTGTFGVFAIMQFSNSYEKATNEDKKILTVLSVLCFFVYGLVLVVLKTPEWQTTYPIIFSFK